MADVSPADNAVPVKPKGRSSAILRFLSSGKYEHFNDDMSMEEVVRYAVYNIGLILGASFLIIFGFFVFREGSHLQAILDVAMGFVCIIIIFLLRTKLSLKVCGLIALSPFGVLCAYLVMQGNERGFALLWVYAYPLLTILILGLNTGIVLSGLLLAAMLVFLVIPGLSNFTYTAQIAGRVSGVYVLVLALTAVYEQVRITKDRRVRELWSELQTERDEVTAMKDNIKTGLFLLDKDYVIQGAYSKSLESVLATDELEGVKFTDILSASIKAKERDTLEDYFGMVMNRSFDAKMLEEINPISELSYIVEHTGEIKTLRSSFAPIDRGRGGFFILGTLEDVTGEKLLQQRLAGEEARREEEMRALFQVIQVEPRVFSDFIEDTEYEFNRINDILKDKNVTIQQAMVDIYQSVHAIKSNALILGLDTFSSKLHQLENQIKTLREKEDINFEDVLHMTVELERIMKEKDKFRDTVSKIEAFNATVGGNRRQDRYVLVETLNKACEKAAEALEKRAKFVVEEIDGIVLEYGPRRVMKEILTQLVRNSVYHGIEDPKERHAAGKDGEGTVKLSIKYENGKMIHIRLADDGKGLDFGKIREKALGLGFVKQGEADDKNRLLQAIFAPGFSTAESADVYAGRGIGLNLVRERVRDLHGSIKLQTEPGKGTVFNVYIPLETPAMSKVS